jgi:hypothetical protein
VPILVCLFGFGDGFGFEFGRGDVVEPVQMTTDGFTRWDNVPSQFVRWVIDIGKGDKGKKSVYMFKSRPIDFRIDCRFRGRRNESERNRG